MFSHFTLGCDDVPRSLALYGRALAPLGMQTEAVSDEFSRVFHPEFDWPWVSLCRPFDDGPAARANGFHLGFLAQDTATVDSFHREALAAGASDDGAPGQRPQYAGGHYGAYVRDVDGNKLQVVCYTEDTFAQRDPTMISHITLGAVDPNASRAFFDPVLGALGIKPVVQESYDTVVGYGQNGQALPLIYVIRTFDGEAPCGGNGTHSAIKAADVNAVHAFYDAALKLGGSCEGPPGPRPHYGEGYYSAYVRDPAGNKLQAVFRGQL